MFTQSVPIYELQIYVRHLRAVLYWAKRQIGKNILLSRALRRLGELMAHRTQCRLHADQSLLPNQQKKHHCYETRTFGAKRNSVSLATLGRDMTPYHGEQRLTLYVLAGYVVFTAVSELRLLIKQPLMQVIPDLVHPANGKHRPQRLVGSKLTIVSGNTGSSAADPSLGTLRYRHSECMLKIKQYHFSI